MTAELASGNGVFPAKHRGVDLVTSRAAKWVLAGRIGDRGAAGPNDVELRR
jgi:hypothetical protein